MSAEPLLALAPRLTNHQAFCEGFSTLRSENEESIGTGVLGVVVQLSSHGFVQPLAVVAQLGLEQLPVEEKVVGSNPIDGATWM